MPTKIFTLFSLILFLSFKCLSQTNYQPGFYITLENDTIHGLINDFSGVGNFRNCQFKSDKSTKSEKFLPTDILAYQFQDGRHFLSKKIYVDSVQRHAFVEFMVDGISDLYFFRDNDNYFYIIENEKGEVIELQREKATDIKIAENKWDPWLHIRKLKVAFSDCMEIQPQIDKADFSHKSLIKLTRDYHNYVCDEYECIVYEKKMGLPSIYIAPIIGMSFSNVSFTEGFLSRFQFDQSINTFYGGQIDAVLSMVNKGLSMQFEVLYQKNNYYGTYTDQLDTYYQLYINSNLLQYSLMAKYKWFLGAIRPSLALGVSFNSLKGLDFDEIIAQSGMPENRIDNPSVYLDPSFTTGVVQLGLNYRVLDNREFFTNFKYSFGSTQSVFGGNTSNSAGKAKFNTISAALGFYLNKVK